MIDHGDGRPVNNERFRARHALYDTGAGISCISKEIAEDLKQAGPKQYFEHTLLKY